MLKAIGFDLGDTLIQYEGVPLAWSRFYKDALQCGFRMLGKVLSDTEIAICTEVLDRFNTRTHPREIEYPSTEVFGIIGNLFKLSEKDALLIADGFFDFFQQRSVCFPETRSVLQAIKVLGIPVGILTDVPYGMQRNRVVHDLELLEGLYDCLLTSVEIGYRKPAPFGYEQLARKLGVKVEELAYIGNEEKDIIGANDSGAFSVLVNRSGAEKSFGEKIQGSDLNDVWNRIKAKLAL